MAKKKSLAPLVSVRPFAALPAARSFSSFSGPQSSTPVVPVTETLESAQSSTQLLPVTTTHPALETEFTGSMHPALQVEDIVVEICRWLGPPELARLVRTTKYFKSAAERELWRTHANLEALLLALPHSLIYRRGPLGADDSLGLTKPIKPSDWAKSRKLASMIQSLDQPRITSLTTSTFLEVLSNGPTVSTSSTLCPQITSLSWTAFDRGTIYAGRFFTSPSLQRVRLTLGGSVAQDPVAVEVFLEHLSLVSPILETLEVVPFLPGTLHMIVNPTALSGCDNLRVITLGLPIDSLPFLKCLSNLPRLHTLRARVGQGDIPKSEQVTFGSLHTLGLGGPRLSLNDTLSIMHIPRLTVLDISVDDIIDNLSLIHFCNNLPQRMKHISKIQLSLTHPSSSVDVTSALGLCTSMTHELTFQAKKLSFTGIDSSAWFFGPQRLILRATAGWKQPLPVPKLSNLLRCFPSLTYLELGLDASAFTQPSPDLHTQQSSLSTLVIYPGPIHSAWPVASFLSSILPSTRITVEAIPTRAAPWNEVVQAIPSLQQFVLDKKRCIDLEKENKQLHERLQRHGLAKANEGVQANPIKDTVSDK